MAFKWCGSRGGQWSPGWGWMLWGTAPLRRPEGTAMAEPRGHVHLPVLPKVRNMPVALAGRVMCLPSHEIMGACISEKLAPQVIK